MDIQIIKDQLLGFEQKGKELRDQEKLFHKAQGLDESAEKARAEGAELEYDLEPMKEDLADLKQKKAEAVASSMDALKSRIDEILPQGKAVFDVSDGVFFGWSINGKVHPFHGLSGGERVIFEGALAHALEADVIIVEAAEIDGKNLVSMLEGLLKIDKQIFVNTCYAPEKLPAGWTVSNLE